ncbi:MAG: tail fiber domain-containing protein [Bacteroidota bacterium]
MKISTLFFACFFTLSTACLSAQVEGVSIAPASIAPHESAMLDVQSTTKGVLFPTMTAVQRNVILNPRHGLVVFVDDNVDNALDGFYFKNGNSGQWQKLGGESLWNTDGMNAWRNPSTLYSTRYMVEFPATDPIYTGEKNGTMVLRSHQSWDNGNVNHWRYIVFGADGNEINSRTNSPSKAGSLFLNHNSGGVVRVGGYSSGLVTDLEVQGKVTAWGGYFLSDQRLKTNIRPIQNALEEVMKTQGVHFAWKNDKTKADHFGFIAQDVEKVFPHLVATVQPDSSKTREAVAYKSLSYNEFVPLLTEAVKEQQFSIQAVNAQLFAQQQQIDKLANQSPTGGGELQELTRELANQRQQIQALEAKLKSQESANQQLAKELEAQQQQVRNLEATVQSQGEMLRKVLADLQELRKKIGN